jgi:hypothetical protein
MEESDPENRANFLPEIECDSAKPNVRSRKDICFSVCEILPHLGFQCSVKTFNDTGFGLLVVSGKEVHVVFFEKRLKYSVDKFSSFV